MGTEFSTREYNTNSCTSQQQNEGGKEITDFEKTIKKRLIEKEMTQKMLAQEVSERTGLKFNQQYVSNVIRGSRTSPRVRDAISEILGIGV